MTLFALSYLDPVGKRWFLANSPGVGNLLRTDQSLLARSWKSPVEPALWVTGLPPVVRAQLGGLDLFVTPLEVVAGEPWGDRIPLRVEPPAVPAAPDGANGPRKRGSSRKAEKPTPLFT